MSRQHRRAEANRRSKRSPRRRHDRFVSVLAQFDGTCHICDQPFTVGDRIYWHPKTAKTKTFRCHETCYRSRTGTLGPTWKPSPPESELRALRETAIPVQEDKR